MLAACSRNLEPVEANIPEVAAVMPESESEHVPGSVIVQFDEASVDNLPVKALEGLGVVSMERLFPDAGEWEPRHRAAGLHRWYRLNYDPSLRPATKAAEDFSSFPGVVFAEPERRIRSTAFFDDTYASRQWSLYNDGSRGPAYDAGCDINVEPVWDNFTTGSPNVIVSVQDGGVQLDHPDLAANCLPGGPEGSKSFVNGFTGYTIYPESHGTHVAGVISAMNDNGVGISGIAGGKKGQEGVRIMSCAIFMNNPEKPDQTIQGDSYNAMVWAADHGAVISQNSWGYVYEDEEDARSGGVGAMKPAIDYFIRYAGCDMEGNQRPDSPMKGGVVIFAAGNEGWPIGWPAAYEPVIAVGATSAQFTRAYYSNWGDWVDICAPGGDARVGPQILSTVTGGAYDNKQGTSMACPHVSGVAALLVSYFGGQGFTNEMLRERLLGGANKKVSPNLLIGPMLDALGSFTLNGSQPPLPATGVSSQSSSNIISLSWKVSSDPDDVKTFSYLALAATDREVLKNLDPKNIPASVKAVTIPVRTTPVGETLSTELTDLLFDTTYYLAVIGYDYSGNYSDLSKIVEVRTGKNNPPVIVTDYTGDYRVQPFGTLEFVFTVSDPDGHEVTTTVEPGSPAFTSSLSGNEVRCKISGNAAPHGVYTAHIVSQDSYGEKTNLAIRYEILENYPPKVIADIPNMLYGKTGESHSIDLSQYFIDQNGETLSYNISMTEHGIININASDNKLVVTTLGYGLTEVTLTATDACKATCSTKFKVLIRDGSRPYDLYPTPVQDVLYIRGGEQKTVDVLISNRAGAVVFSQEGVQMDPFSPLSVDFKGQPGGVYYVRIGEERYTVVKQ